MFTLYTLNDSDYEVDANPENTPAPMMVFEDDANTGTGGNQSGDVSNDSGQRPGVTTRRDSHGMAATNDAL